MKFRNLPAAAAVFLPLLAFAEALHVSGEFVFRVDTTGDPCTITSATDSVSLWHGKGDFVVAAEKESLASETVIQETSSAGVAFWRPPAGGVWTLRNSRNEKASVLVRYSIFGEQAGTESSPAKFVDAVEFSELAAAGIINAGYVFTLYADTLLGRLPAIDGCHIENIGGATYRLAASSGGELYKTAASGFAVYSVRPGPDRRIKKGETWPVFLPGDRKAEFNRDPVLKVTCPSGASAESGQDGDITVPFAPVETGRYTLSLKSSSQTLSASINVTVPTFTIHVR